MAVKSSFKVSAKLVPVSVIDAAIETSVAVAPG